MIYLEFEDGETLDLDVVESLSPSFGVDKTTHEVEDGSEITDNINIKADVIQISGFISNVPLTATGAFDPEAEGPHTAFFDRVKTACKAGEVVDLVAGVFGVYQDFQITACNPEFATDTGSGLPYQLTLEEIRIVNAKVEVNKPNPGKRPAGRADADRLGQQTRPGGSVAPSAPTTGQTTALTTMSGRIVD